MSAAPVPVDLDRVRREIDEEVRARRDSGDFPPGMERELDLAFARVSPVGSTGDDLEGLLEAADRAAFIESQPPTASRIVALTVIKKTERKLLGWYFNHMAQQVTSFAGATVRALTVLTERLEQVERSLPRAELASLGHSATEGLANGLAAAVVAALAGVDGRVLVAGDDPGVLRALDGVEGLDAYGVAPTITPSIGSPVERRDGDPLTHLAHLAPESLGGLVVLGTDPLPTGAKVSYIDAAAGALTDRGRLVVIAGRPEAWGHANPVEADLAAGHPFRAETWVVVVESRGFVDAEVHELGDSLVVSALLRR